MGVTFPQAFRDRLIGQKYIDAGSLLEALSEPSPVSIRINRAKWNAIPAGSEKVPWCDNGFYLPVRPPYTLDPLFHAGSYYPQEASGMFLEEVFKQIAPDGKYLKVLDLCGAPGGKATHLSSLIGNNGFLVANEVIRQRASVLAENLTKWGLSNVIVTQNDPSAFGSLQGYFDVILIDAPCSGEGMFRDAIAVNEWSPENSSLCSERQKRILMDVWPALKENGILIYSTCTFNPAENEENIKWLVSKNEAEPISLDISGYGSITEIDYSGIFGYGFYPGKSRGEGLFISVLRKKSDGERRVERQKKSKLIKVSGEDAATALKWSSFSQDSLIKVGENIISFPGTPADFEILSGSLRLIKSGTMILTGKQDKFIPSHELAMSVYIKDDQFPHAETDLGSAISFLKRESHLSYGSSMGWNLVTYKGVRLGFLKNIGNRINNYYPMEWRIRMSIPDNPGEHGISWLDQD